MFLFSYKSYLDIHSQPTRIFTDAVAGRGYPAPLENRENSIERGTMRKKLMNIRVDPDVYDRWKRKAKEAGITLTELIHRSVEDGKIIGDEKRGRRYAPVDPALIRQLASIGNLMNQIARKLNMGSEPDREMADSLKKIESELKKILAKHKKGVEEERSEG